MHLRKSAVLAVCLVAASLPALANDWPQWRGPDRSGVSKETGLLAEWPKDGPKLMWEAKGAGRGYGTAAAAKSKLYTLGDGPSTASDKDEYLSCFDEGSGKQLWQTRLGPAWTNGSPDWQSSRSTPTVDDDRVYVVSPQGTLHCLGTADGKLRWKKDFKEVGGKKGDGWGYSESVLIDGDKVVCTPGGPKTTMWALDKKTGKEVWKASAPDNRGAGHASIIPSEVGGTRVYVQMTASGAIGVRAKDGKLLWTSPAGGTAVIPTPIVRGDLVFFSIGYNQGGALLRQVPSGNGEVKVEKLYGLEKALNNKHGGVVLVGDNLYGDTNDGHNLFCADLMTGKVLWTGRPPGRGSISVTAADEHLYLRGADGTMVLAEASSAAYKGISSFKIPGSGERPSWSHPVIANGRLYLREQDRILCYDIKASANTQSRR